MGSEVSRLFLNFTVNRSSADSFVLARQQYNYTVNSLMREHPIDSLFQGVVIVMTDTRPVGRSLVNASLNTLTAVLNFLYAKRHGYTFIYYRMTAQCVHPIQNQRRVGAWCKPLGMWETAIAPEHTGKRILLLDGDCVVLGQYRSFDDWVSVNLTAHKRFGVSPVAADIVLLNDHFADPYCRSGFGNGGFIITKTGPTGERLMRRWWDVYDERNSWSFEQNALGALLREGDGAMTTVCVPHNEFMAAGPSSFVYHSVQKKQTKHRVAVEAAGIRTDDDFSRVVDDMIADGALRDVDPSVIAARMAIVSAYDPVFYVTCPDNYQCRRSEDQPWSLRNDCRGIPRSDCIPPGYSVSFTKTKHFTESQTESRRRATFTSTVAIASVTDAAESGSVSGAGEAAIVAWFWKWRWGSSP